MLHTGESQHRSSGGLTLSNDPSFNIMFGMLPSYNDGDLAIYDGPTLETVLPNLLSSNYGESSAPVEESHLEHHNSRLELTPEMGIENESFNLSLGINDSFPRVSEIAREVGARAGSSAPNPSTPIRKRSSDRAPKKLKPRGKILGPRPVKQDESTTLATAFINSREITYVERSKAMVRRSVSAQMTLQASKMTWENIQKPPSMPRDASPQPSPPSIELERYRGSTHSQSRQSILGSELSLKFATPDSRPSITPSTRRRGSRNPYQDDGYDYNMDDDDIDIDIDIDMDLNTQLELPSFYNHPYLLLGFLPPASSQVAITINQLAELANEAQANLVSKRTALTSTFLHVLILAQQGKVELQQAKIRPDTAISVRQK